MSTHMESTIVGIPDRRTAAPQPARATEATDAALMVGQQTEYNDFGLTDPNTTSE